MLTDWQKVWTSHLTFKLLLGFQLFEFFVYNHIQKLLRNVKFANRCKPIMIGVFTFEKIGFKCEYITILQNLIKIFMKMSMHIKEEYIRVYSYCIYFVYKKLNEVL